MLQNRVDPFGNLIKTKARGLWLGNRGNLHGAGKTILRLFKHQAWIICELEFKNRHRDIMGPNLWTELFFLDEATAFAAGHRPCFECRREAATRFKQAWLAGNPEYGYDRRTSITKIDEVLQQERIDAKGRKVNFEAKFGDLPAGAFIILKDDAYVVSGKKAFRWAPEGYEKGIAINEDDVVNVLTPKSVLKAFKSGYEPSVKVDH